MNEKEVNIIVKRKKIYIESRYEGKYSNRSAIMTMKIDEAVYRTLRSSIDSFDFCTYLHTYST